MYTKIEQEIFNERIPKIFFGICLERKEYHRGAYSMEATGAEKGMFSEEEQFYAYTEQSEESEVSTAGKVMWKTISYQCGRRHQIFIYHLLVAMKIHRMYR